jgi:AcrR family transcriptional regulator
MTAVENERGRGGSAVLAPAKRQREDTRERILEVATEEFAQKGLAGARVDEIARKAQANKQLVYYYFGGKLGLYNEVLGHMIQESRQRIAAEAACETLAEKFRLMVDRGTESTGVRWQRLLASEALEADPTEEFFREADRSGTWQRHVASVREAEAGARSTRARPGLVAWRSSRSVFPFVLPQVTSSSSLLPTEGSSSAATRISSSSWSGWRRHDADVRVVCLEGDG